MPDHEDTKRAHRDEERPDDPKRAHLDEDAPDVEGHSMRHSPEMGRSHGETERAG